MNGITIRVRNVNAALSNVIELLYMHDLESDGGNWRVISPRGMETLEWRGVFTTIYRKPDERVLFDAVRDANPFFHFFEALWILAGMQDVATLAQYNSNIKNFSDDGKVFHAPYGHRLRHSVAGDQVMEAIYMLRDDKNTRQVVLSIWDAAKDLNVKSKDIPCNDIIFLKVREDKLNMTVCCRSNDIIWGAYGANAVQFSMLQEFIARSVGVGIGEYTQVSDSFHVYTDNEAYKRLLDNVGSHTTDLYSSMTLMRPHPLMDEKTSPIAWLSDLGSFMRAPSEIKPDFDPFFADVAEPIWLGWQAYKAKDHDRAIKLLEDCKAYDWSTACQQWIMRRIK